MKKFIVFNFLFLCTLSLLFSSSAMADRLENGKFAEAWVDYEKDFNDYMLDYISEKTKGLKYTRGKKMLSKKEYKKKVRAFKSVEKSFTRYKKAIKYKG